MRGRPAHVTLQLDSGTSDPVLQTPHRDGATVAGGPAVAGSRAPIDLSYRLNEGLAGERPVASRLGTR